MAPRSTPTRLDSVIARGLRRLDPRARSILEARFGLGGAPRKTLEAVGKALRLSRERVRQIEKQALDLLRREDELRDAFEACVAF